MAANLRQLDSPNPQSFVAENEAKFLTHPGSVSVRNLVRSFGSKSIFDGLDLDIAPGEFVVLLGPSGCGKSTLLRALAGLDHGTAGSGAVRVPERVSVVFQDSRLLPWERVLGNVILGLHGADATTKGRKALTEVGLEGRERAWPHELSGGEQQRVSLARSLVRNPQLLLADEPFGALDAATRIRMHALIRDLVAAHKPAVLLVTHDVDEAISLADRIIFLDNGRVSTVHTASLSACDVTGQGKPHTVTSQVLKNRLLASLGLDFGAGATKFTYPAMR